MSPSSEKRYFIANWKMNLTFEEVKTYVHDFSSFLKNFSDPSKEILIAPSFPYLPYLKESLAPYPVSLCAQDISSHEKGPFTGDVSGLQLKSVGTQYVLIGHSERRQYHKEDTALLLQKSLRAWEVNITPIYCVGETATTREEGQTLEFIRSQISPFLTLFKDQKDTVPSSCPFLLAYEPIWAIGTGKVASLSDIEEVHATLHKTLLEILPAYKIPILYGGSVTPQNAGSLISSPLINGFLVGGSSLLPASFIDILQA